MLKSCKKRVTEMMPKTGRFLAVYLDCDTEAEPIGKLHRGKGLKYHNTTEYAWESGTLYEFDGCDWEPTTVEKEMDHLHREAVGLMFVRIPEVAIELEPIKTLEEIEAEEAAEELERKMKDVRFMVNYGAFPYGGMMPLPPGVNRH